LVSRAMGKRLRENPDRPRKARHPDDRRPGAGTGGIRRPRHAGRPAGCSSSSGPQGDCPRHAAPRPGQIGPGGSSAGRRLYLLREYLPQRLRAARFDQLPRVALRPGHGDLGGNVQEGRAREPRRCAGGRAAPQRRPRPTPLAAGHGRADPLCLGPDRVRRIERGRAAGAVWHDRAPDRAARLAAERPRDRRSLRPRSGGIRSGFRDDRSGRPRIARLHRSLAPPKEPRMTGPSRPVRFPPDTRPMLLTAIHTEEEFDWSRPFDSGCCEVTHLRELGRAVEIFDRLGMTPTYLLDYPVASREDGVRAVTEAIDGTGAAIGAHLHPWVNPPVTEAITRYTSYPGTLPPALERAKLATLTDCIARNFGRHPTTYLAGRYGFGERTLSILQELGYRVDLSPVAMGDFRGDGGPDFRDWASDCRWEGSPPILRVPHSAADTGMLCRGARRLVDPERVAALRRLRVPGMLARLGAVRRIRLTPEGFSLSEMIA